MSDRRDAKRHAVAPAAAQTRPASGDAYAVQRAMRDRLRAAKRQGRLAVVDVGSHKICAAIVGFEDDEIRVLGAAHLRSRGVRSGVVVDMPEAEQAVRAAVAHAERAAGLRVYHGLASLGGGFPRSLSAAAEVASADPARISEGDLAKALSACRAPSVGPAESAEARTILHAVPAAWRVDGEQTLGEPTGLAGRRLRVDVHLLSAAESAARNVVATLRSADLEPAGVVSGAYAASLACLTREEREHGAACLDLGGGATGAALFLRGQLVFADLVRLGGEHVTLDVSRGLGFDFDEAERLKILEGSAIVPGAGRAVGYGGDPLSSRGLAERYGDRRGPTRSDLSAIIRPRVEEILELARDRLEQAGFGYLPNRRAVLTGGAAQLPGVLETAQRILGLQVRVGRPRWIAGAPTEFAGPAFSALSGLIDYAARRPDELWDFVRPEQPRAGGVGAKLLRWIRETW